MSSEEKERTTNKSGDNDSEPPPYTAVYGPSVPVDSIQYGKQGPGTYGVPVYGAHPIPPVGYVGNPATLPAHTYIVQAPASQQGQVFYQYPVVQAQPLIGNTTITPGPVPYDYMMQAILVTVCCFFPTGIFAVLKASEAKSSLLSGDIQRANQLSQQAKKYINVSIVLGILCCIAMILICILIPIYMHASLIQKY